MIRRTIISSIALILALAVPLHAHEKGAIYLASKQVAVVGELALRGVKLPKNAAIGLQLRGTLNTYPIGDVKTDTAGAFQATLALPPHVLTGVYTVVAIAVDGDVTARADLVIVPAPAVVQRAKPAMPGMQSQMPGGHASAEMMAVDQDKSLIERIIVAVLVLLSFGGGALLLQRAAGVHRTGRQ